MVQGMNGIDAGRRLITITIFFSIGELNIGECHAIPGAIHGLKFVRTNMDKLHTICPFAIS